jgi:predicted ester cyclase
MTTEQNKELVTRMIDEIFNRGNVDKADEFLASDFVEREELPPGLPPGREGVKQLAIMMRSAFPDLKGTIEDAVAEDDKVVVRWTCAGTHSAPSSWAFHRPERRYPSRDRHHPHRRRQVRRALGPDG